MCLWQLLVVNMRPMQVAPGSDDLGDGLDNASKMNAPSPIELSSAEDEPPAPDVFWNKHWEY